MAKPWAKAFYTSKLWRDTRRQILRRDNYTCAYCAARAEEVHHIIELTPANIMDAGIALNPDNLISLCHECHTKITQGFTGDVRDGFIFDDDGQVAIPPRSKNKINEAKQPGLPLCITR